MKAVIVSTGLSENLNPLSDWVPEFLTPIVNKPIAEHQVELLVRHNIKDIIMNINHLPYETEQYFGNGERWGAKITYSLEKNYKNIGASLVKLQSKLIEPYICLSQNILTNFDLTCLIEAHKNSHAELTFTEQIKSREKPNTFLPFILTPKAIAVIQEADNIQTFHQILELLKRKGCSVETYCSSFEWKELLSTKDFWAVNRSILDGEIDGIIIPGQNKKAGIRIGRHTHIHPDAKLSPLLLIGNYCNIRKGAYIGNETILGNNIIVDQNASVQKSIILDNTYIGSSTEIKDSIVRKNYIVNVPRSVSAFVRDDFILGDLEKQIINRKGERFFNLFAALALMFLFLPLFTALFLYHILFPSRNYFYSEKMFGQYEISGLQGNMMPKTFKLFSFRSNHLILQKLPGLLNVIKGDMNLAGNLPLTEAEAGSLKEEWETLRFKAPVGLFHLWEAEPEGEITWEEKMVIENYYALKRSFWGDIKILFKSFFNLTQWV